MRRILVLSVKGSPLSPVGFYDPLDHIKRNVEFFLCFLLLFNRNVLHCLSILFVHLISYLTLIFSLLNKASLFFEPFKDLL